MALDDSVAEKLLVLNETLAASGLPYAFGGAIALAYCVYEARGTHDLDINVFVPATAAAQVVAVLRPHVRASPAEVELLERDGQVRLHWGEMPVDIFLSTDPFHEEAHAAVRRVPFVRGVIIPVLGCAHLAVFKTFFNRGKDFVDIGHMVEAETVVPEQLRATVVELLGADAPQVASLDAAIAEAERATEDPMGGRFSPPRP